MVNKDFHHTRRLDCTLSGPTAKDVGKCSVAYVNYCMEMFNVQTPHYTIPKRKCKFLSNMMSSKNVLCELCREFAEKELVLCAHPSN